jgi:HAD superfamily hydrolase (TIGR01509 family)
MQPDTVIFDMDGLLVDSEPLWNHVAKEVLAEYGILLTEEQYHITTGLRTREFLQYWFNRYGIASTNLASTEQHIINQVMARIPHEAPVMPGVPYIFNFFSQRGFKIGIASTSPPQLIELVTNLTGIKPYIQHYTSAQHLAYAKPHPEVYLNCAALLGSDPLQCICFEDSFNGMIAVKAARMKAVVVPHHSQQKQDRWAAADLRLSSLVNFGELHLNLLAQGI